MNAYTIYTGYTADDLNAMYTEARGMMMACLYASDKGNANKWKRIAIDCAVTLHAMQNEDTL